jgi:pimeloyl-ACP methyl ester carboxylesterase
MVSLDGSVDYARLLARTNTPALVVAGKLDRTAPGAAVRAGFEALGGPREYFVAGEENGCLHDYGHMDLLLADRAPVELWPRLLAFLDRHRPAGGGGE